MDTLSHTIIGFAVAGLSRQPLTLHDPLFWATVLGAQAPDLDIITILKGKLAYLRQHRTFSHSIPGLCLWSTIISLSLPLCMPTAQWGTVWGWSFAGGLSHILFDYLNTHGASLLWPFRKERLSLNLLNVFDPFFFLTTTIAFLFDQFFQTPSLFCLLAITVYLATRAVLRWQASIRLQCLFFEENIMRILIIPSLTAVWSWSFVIETPDKFFLGNASALSSHSELLTELPKEALSSYKTQAQETAAGYFFHAFTSWIYIKEQREEDSIQVTLYDLRYLFDQQFIHSATIFFDTNHIPRTAYMMSYGQKINIPG